MFQKIRHKKINIRYDSQLNLYCVIAVHSTALGPSMGGIRMRPSYTSADEVIEDAIKLSRAMTYKNALAGLNYGGGKAVVWADPRTDKTQKMLKKIAGWVEELDGAYIAAEDMGMETKDLEYMSQFSKHVTGFSENFVSRHGRRGGGDPSPMTSYGVYEGIKAALTFVFGTDSFAGRTINLQGVGKVGEGLLKYIFSNTPYPDHVFITDTDKKRLSEVSRRYPKAQTVPSDESIYTGYCDVFVPCAIGGILNDRSIPRLRCKIIAGAANNQLENEERHGQMLYNTGILYAPDFAINAGGVINIADELEPDGYNAERARARTRRIADTLKEIFERSRAEDLPTNVTADKMAQERLSAAN